MKDKTLTLQIPPQHYWQQPQPQQVRQTISQQQTRLPLNSTNQALRDYHMRMMLLEQRNKKHHQQQQIRQPITQQQTPYPPNANSNHALQDYQMQLMLLEQQNKKRDLMIRREEEERAHMRQAQRAKTNRSTRKDSKL